MANDAQVAKEQVSIAFRQSEYIPPKYVFEMDDRPDEDQMLRGAVRIRKYPAYPPGSWSPVGTPMYFDQGVTVVVTEGDIYTTNEVREKECFGSAVMSGDSELSLPYPVVHDLDYAIDGEMYDVRGNRITVNMAYNSLKNSLVFSRPCYGVVRYSFITQYVILRYYPNIYNDIETYYMPDPKDYGELLGFIKTPAVLDPISPILFSITPPQGISAEFELYRVESTAFANEDGLWEKPSGWPNSGTYDGYPDTSKQLDPKGSYVEIARTHEIGYFSLVNKTRRMEGYQSTSSESLPLDYSKEMKYERSAGGIAVVGTQTAQQSANGTAETLIAHNVQVQKKEYFDKYRRLINNAPLMRTVHYDVPVAEPYKSGTDINSIRPVPRLLSAAEQRVTDAQGNVISSSSSITTTMKTFKIKLTVKVPTRPAVSSATLRNQANNGNTDLNTQALRVNSMLSMIWEGVDWRLLRKRIMASYDTDIYQITFDSSFPQN